jgi:tetratricopeptide (TPR) repeat protein
MKRWSWLLIAALVAAPALAGEKKKDDKKKKDAPVVQAPQAADPLKQAQDLLAAGNADDAIAVLEKAMPTSGAAALKLGELRETRGELDLAVDAYKAAAGKLEGAAKGEALGRLAVVEDVRGMADAPASAEAAAAADPEGVWPTIALSYRRAHEDKVDEAVALAEKALAAGGGAPAQAALGHALEAKGDLKGAETAYRAAMAEDPNRLVPVIGLASVLRRTGRAAEAEPLLEKVIAASPGAVDAYKEQARVKVALGRADEAIGDANIAAALSENDPEAQRLVVEVKVARALQAVDKGQADFAVQDLTALRDQNPESADVRLGLGRAQIARRDTASAITELTKATELDPKLAEAFYQLGFVQLMMKGDAKAALAPLEKAASLEPQNALYATSFGAALVGAGSFDKAIEVLTAATALPDYDREEGYVALGQAFVNTKRYQDAVAPLEKATALKPDDAGAWATLGWAYFGLKDADKFKDAAGKARSLGYKEPTLLSYLKRVEGGEAIK